MSIRILLADDHAVVRRGLKQIISETVELSVADEATDGYDALDKALRNDYDLVLLDISMPGSSGIEVLQRLRSERPKVPVLVLSIHSEKQYALRALKAGAFGYLTKASAPEELSVAIRRILEGGRYISPPVAEALAVEFEKGTDRAPHERLSQREAEVLRRIASGMSLKGAADEMHLSVKTVSTYRARILEKMGMKSNADLTRYAIRNQLVEG
ncbi:MAG: response regulator transcription factor [Deltaproteobacteria bacterium]|nr:response regulator transcription factor [Deltaproteobacteria bacterium]